MSELFIAILALVLVGKIHGREAVATQVVLLRTVAAFNHRPVSHSGHENIQVTSTTPRLYTNEYRPADRNYEHSQSTRGSDNFNLTPPTVRQREPQLFISTKISDKMERPLNVTGSNANRHSSSDSDKDVNKVTSPNDSTNFVVPPNRNDTSGPKNNTNTTPSVDERSSFSGDPCPPGKVRFNGECVKMD